MRQPRRPGELTTEKSFTVRIFDDSVAEGAETIWLELFQPEGAAILGTPRHAHRSGQNSRRSRPLNREDGRAGEPFVRADIERSHAGRPC
jgi:hypothetical protein